MGERDFCINHNDCMECQRDHENRIRELEGINKAYEERFKTLFSQIGKILDKQDIIIEKLNKPKDNSKAFTVGLAIFMSLFGFFIWYIQQLGG